MIREGARQGAQWKCMTKKHDILYGDDKDTSKLKTHDKEAREWKTNKVWSCKTKWKDKGARESRERGSRHAETCN